MKKQSFIFLLSLLVSVFILNAQPSVTIVSVDNITATKARFRGNIQQLGNRINDIKTRGFIIAKVGANSSADTLKYSENAPKRNEIYSYEITDYQAYLDPKTDYSVKAFITLKKSSSDTEYVYSEASTFKTADPIGDHSTVALCDNVTLSSASLKGTIESAGNSEALEDCGFVYSTTQHPTLTSTNATYVQSTFNPNRLYPKQITTELYPLLSSTTYYYRIWVINRYNDHYVDTTYSEQKSFTTLHACGAIPQKLDTVVVEANSAELQWEAQEGQVKFEVEYGFSGHKLGEGTIVEVEDTRIVLDDLESNRSYTSYVRAVCDDRTSGWSNMRPFHTKAALCEKVMGLHVDHATHVTAKIEWTAGQVSQNKWEVLFARNDGVYPATPFVVENNPVYFPIGLTINTEYKVKVRAVCTIYYDSTVVDTTTGDSITTTTDSTAYGEWSDDLIFRTASSSLEEGSEINHNVTVFPNPTTNLINFIPKGKAIDMKKIEIYSELGTLVYTNNILPSQIDLSAFGSGTFIIHIITNKGIQVEKVTVK